MAIKKVNPNEELVEYTAPLAPGSRQDVLVSVNGETIRIKRGSRVKIKRKFLKVLNQSADQEFAAYKEMEAAQRRSRRPMAEM